MQFGSQVFGALLCLQLLLLSRAMVIKDSSGQQKFNDELGQRQAFTLDDVITSAYSSDTFNGTWISETEIFYRVADLLLKFDTTEQKSEIIAKNPASGDLEKLKFFLSPDKNYILIRELKESVYRHSTLSLYSVYNIRSKSLSKLAQGQLLSTAIWAPQGSSLAYVLNNDIYYHRIDGDDLDTRRVTFDGKEQAIYNGVPDWVYEEEVFGTDRVMWFSPSGDYLAFATFNDTEVHEAVIMRYGDPGNLKDQYPKEEKFRYPKAGTKNPRVSLNIVDLTDYGSSIISLKAPVEIVGSEPILFAVTWFDDKTPLATWTNRVQNISQLVIYSLTGGIRHLHTRESPDGWLLFSGVPPIHHSGYVVMLKPQPVENATLGLFGHLTRFRLLNDVLDHEVDLTPGTLWVSNLHGFNRIKYVVYFTACPPGEPSQKQLYEVNLLFPKGYPSVPRCVSCGFKSPEGNPCKYVSSVKFSTDFTRFALTCGGPDPATVRVYDYEGSELYTWTANRELREMLTKRTLPKQMDLTVPSGGFDARVRLLLPNNFDDSKKYPLLVNVYAGPDSQRINDNFAVGFESYMTTNRQVVHAWIDGRGSASKGTANLFSVYRKLGTVEIEDQISVTKNLQHTYPWIDSNRTAIWGWSYGGYSTVSVLTKDDDNVFKCGISVAPVTNWIYYDSIYTERFMSLPTDEDNLKNYQSSSVLNRAEQINGKKFMLVHGTGDDNVHFQQSMALAKALAINNVLYDQVSYPDEAHGLIHVTKHLYRTMDKFWSECFGY